MDVFITLLSLGWRGYHHLVQERKVISQMHWRQLNACMSISAGKLPVLEGKCQTGGNEVRRKGAGHTPQPHLHR